MSSATIFETKTRLSELIRKVQKGETVVITSGREKTPVAKLAPIVPVKFKRLGVCYNPKFVLPSDFFDAPTEEELREWEG